MNDSILGPEFARLASTVSTYAYMQDGTDRFLATFGPTAFRSSAEFLKRVGTPLYMSSIGIEDGFRKFPGVQLAQRNVDTDADAERNFRAPRRAVLNAYVATLEKYKLDGFVYPAIQMPPVDESMPQDGRVSEGPHSATSWVNMIGVPAIVVPAGVYASGLPFGLEFSARAWQDASLLSVAAAWERTAQWRKTPVLVERGLLPVYTARNGRAMTK